MKKKTNKELQAEIDKLRSVIQELADNDDIDVGYLESVGIPYSNKNQILLYVEIPEGTIQGRVSEFFDHQYWNVEVRFKGEVVDSNLADID